MDKQQKNINLTELDEPLIHVSRNKRIFFFVILYGLFMVDFIARTGVNAVFPVLQMDLGLTDTQLGTLASVVLLGMAVFVLPVSYWGEKHSPKKAINLSAFIWSLGSVLSGVASSFFLLVVARFFVGTGNAAYAPLSNSMITSMYKKSQWGKMIGLYNTAMTFGGAAGALIFANLSNTLGWRAAFYIIGGVSFLFTILSLLLPETKKVAGVVNDVKAKAQEQEQVNLRDAAKVTMQNKALLCTCLGAGLGVMALQSLGTYAAIYYVRICGMSIATAAALLGASNLIAALGYPVGGAIMDAWYKKDKRSRVFLPAICLTVCAILYAAGFQFQIIPILLIGQFFYTMGNTGFHAASQELVPVWFKSVSYGVYVLFIQLLGAVGPVCAGILSDTLGLVNALVVIQGLFVIATLVLIMAGFFYLKDYQAARRAEQEAIEKGMA